MSSDEMEKGGGEGGDKSLPHSSTGVISESGTGTVSECESDDIPGFEQVPPDSAVTVYVNGLKYLTSPLMASMRESEVVTKLPQGPLVKRLKKVMDSDVTKDLKDVSFRALPGQLTAVLAIDQAERR
jgi:hypothetical protein